MCDHDEIAKLAKLQSDALEASREFEQHRKSLPYDAMGEDNHSKRCPMCAVWQAAGNQNCVYCAYVFTVECCGDPATVHDYIGVRPVGFVSLTSKAQRASALAMAVDFYRSFRNGDFDTAENYIKGLQIRRENMFRALDLYLEADNGDDNL